MASGYYLTALGEILDGTIDLENDTLKFMLVGTSAGGGYVYDTDHDVIDNAADDATDPSYNELSATNYTGGYGGAGRKTASITQVVDKTNNVVYYSFDNVTWTELGGAANDASAAAILIKEITDDTASRVIAYFDQSNFVTNGSDYTLVASSAGNLRHTPS